MMNFNRKEHFFTFVVAVVAAVHLTILVSLMSEWLLSIYWDETVTETPRQPVFVTWNNESKSKRSHETAQNTTVPLGPAGNALFARSETSFNPICHLLVANTRVDAHYEVLESVVLRYALPWKNDPACQSAGRNASNPIVVDMMSMFKHSKDEDRKTEAFGYQIYFESHLYNTTRRRHVDARYVRYNSFSIFGKWYDFHESVKVGDYDYIIEASCDVSIKKAWRNLRSNPRRYCVLHGESNPPKVLRDRTCYLNPQHAPSCWFLPLDFPKFIPPPNGSKSEITICTPASKNSTRLLVTLELLQLPNVKVAIYGRNANVPNGFLNLSIASAGHYRSFYDFQRFIASCHILVPMLEPTRLMSMYFTGSKKLSGSIAQILGNRIPSVLHTSVLDIYREEMTAPYFVYDYNISTGTDSFDVALVKALKLYRDAAAFP